MIDRKNDLVLSCICCMKRNRNGVIALDANSLYQLIIEKGFTINGISDLLKIDHDNIYQKIADVSLLTVGETLLLKSILELSDSEAISIFLGA